MACGFGADPLREALGQGDGQGPRVRYVEEDEPLGTAGPMRLAADEGLLGERFLVLNGDLLSDLDLGALVRGHEERGAVASLALSPVADPSAYGLVRRAGGPTAPGASPASVDGEVLEFIEKPDPGQIDTDEVSAGAYVLERSLVELIPPGQMVSIEREVFPRLVGQGLYGHRLEGYWMDIGTPERYMQASWDILEGRVPPPSAPAWTAPAFWSRTACRSIPARASAHPRCWRPRLRSAAGATVGGRAVIGRRSEIGEGATVSGSVVLSDCRIGSTGKRRRGDPGARRRGRRGRAGGGRRRDRRGGADRGRGRDRRRGAPGTGRGGIVSDAMAEIRAIDPAKQLDRGSRPPRTALGRAVAGRVREARAVRRGRRPRGLRHGRIGDRRRPGRRRVRKPAQPAARHRAQLRAALRIAPRPRRALLELLRGHRGDDRLLRGRRGARRPANRRDHRWGARRRRPGATASR